MDAPAGGEALAAQGSAPTQKKGCFPCAWLNWLPAQLRMCVPGTWRVIQDATHLSLVLGIVCFCFMVLAQFLEAYNHLMDPWALGKLVCVAYLTLSLFMYISRTIGRYDQGLIEREQKIQEQRRGLVDSYDQLVKDIDGMLNRAKESTQALAESEFNSKRKDFMRFVERIEDRFDRAIQVGTEEKRKETFNNFKKFCIMWLKVYEECSLDPINSPFRLVDTSEFDSCRTIPEICRKIKEQAKFKDVSFLKRIDDGASMLKDKQATISRMSVISGPVTWGNDKGGIIEIELSTQVRRPVLKDFSDPSDSEEDSDGHGDVEKGSARGVRAKKATTGSKALFAWIKFGKGGFGPFCCCGRGKTESFPHGAGCLCGEVLIMSATHLNLILAFFVNVVLVGICIAELCLRPGGYVRMIFPLSLGLIQSVFMILAYFEQLDIIQRMEKELVELGAEKDALENKKEEMTEYWEQVQAITDIWVHRVTPRLFLHKEVQACLEDIRTHEEFNKSLSTVNTVLVALEDSLPELAHWKADGKISIADKKHFDDAVKKICNKASDIETVTHNLHKLVTVQRAIPAG